MKITAHDFITGIGCGILLVHLWDFLYSAWPSFPGAKFHRDMGPQVEVTYAVFLITFGGILAYRASQRGQA